MSLSYRLARCCVPKSTVLRAVWLRPLATSAPIESKLPSEKGDKQVSTIGTVEKSTKPTWGEYLFEEGWRRPLKISEGAVMRREWVSFGYSTSNEHLDWLLNHIYAAMVIVGVFSWFFFLMVYKQDWPDSREWAVREAYVELARREKFGLPLISPDYIDRQKVLAVLPSDEELGDFPVVI